MNAITLPLLVAVAIGGPRVGIWIGPLGFGLYCIRQRSNLGLAGQEARRA